MRFVLSCAALTQHMSLAVGQSERPDPERHARIALHGACGCAAVLYMRCTIVVLLVYVP